MAQSKPRRRTESAPTDATACAIWFYAWLDDMFEALRGPGNQSTPLEQREDKHKPRWLCVVEEIRELRANRDERRKGYFDARDEILAWRKWAYGICQHIASPPRPRFGDLSDKEMREAIGKIIPTEPRP